MSEEIFTLTQKYNNIQKRLYSTVYVNGIKKEIKALWDTGADQTCISNQLATSLNLSANHRQTKTMSATGVLSKLSMYDVDLTLISSAHSPDEVFKRNRFLTISLIAVGVDFRGVNNDTDIVIGMDIISQGDLAISNFDNKTTFTFRYPSIGKIDFRE